MSEQKDIEHGVINDSRHANYGAVEQTDDFHCHGSVPEVPSSNKRARRILWITLTFCMAFMCVEIVGGIVAQSLAIITDAAHLLTDLASILISLFSLYIANRPASQRMSFGWYRSEVLGAFLSVFLIWIITGILVYMAIDRMINNKYDINAQVMAFTAGLGVIVNVIMALLLHFGGHSHSHSHGGHSHLSNGTSGNNNSSKVNINVRATMIHVIGDFIQSVGVLIAALIILFNENWSVVDPICTLLFSVIVLCTTIYVVRDAFVVLLEGRPSNIDFRSVFYSLEKIDGVKKVHDLRIWALTMERIAISVHLEIAQDGNGQKILRDTTLMLRNEFGVHESTIQIEGYNENSNDCRRCIPPS